MTRELEKVYKMNFGFVYKERKIWADNVRVKSIQKVDGSEEVAGEWDEISAFPEIASKP